MSSTHATFFGQSQPHTLPEGDGEPATSGNENTQTKADSAFMPVRWPHIRREQEPEEDGNKQGPEFRRNLVARIETVKTEKMTRLGIEPRPSWTYTSSSNQLSYQVLLGSSW